VQELREAPTMFRIGYLNQAAHLYGAEKSLLDLIRNISRDQYEPIVILHEEGPLAQELRSAGAEVVTMPFRYLSLRSHPSLSTVRGYLNSCKMLSSIVREHKIDLLHANDLDFFQLAGPVAKLKRIPGICHVRTVRTRKEYVLDFAWLADVVVANSGATARPWEWLAGRRVHIISNPVDARTIAYDAHKREQTRQHLGLCEDNFVAAVAGRIIRHKGQDVFLEALRIVNTSANRQMVGLIVGGPTRGTGNFESELHEFVQANKMEDCVRFVPFMDDVSALYSAIDVLVLPSTYEPFGRVLTEAMACGRPCLATDAGGAREIVLPDVTGRLFPVGDAETLARELVYLRDNPDIADAWGQAGRQCVLQKYTISGYVNSVQAIYEELLGSRSPEQ